MPQHPLPDTYYPVQSSVRSPQSSSLDGCVSADGAVMGTYLHGLFENRCIRTALVNWLIERRGLPPLQWEETVRRREADYDRLAEALRQNLGLPALYRIAGLGGK